MGATIIAGGFGLIGNTSTAYAAKVQSPPKIEESVNENTDQSTIKDDKQTKVESSAPVDETKENLEETPAQEGENTGADTNSEETGQKQADPEPEAESSSPAAEDTAQDQAPAEAQIVDPAPEEVDKAKDEVNKDVQTAYGAEIPSEDQEDKATDPNYAEDEKKIEDYSEKERYRSTQMEQGAGTTATSSDPSMESKDGFSYKTLEPVADSPDKKQWSIEMEFDKEKGQRTYTDFGFSNSDNLKNFLDAGTTIEANYVENKISETGDFKDPTYKADADLKITASGRDLRNLNLYPDEKDLEHINNKDNNNTVMAWEGKYKKDNPYGPYATQGGSATFTFTVNPWPNENDKLSLIKLNGSYDKKEFVQGQTINTEIQVENLDENARERLVGQVYHPVTGEIVPDAKAYIDDNDMVVIEMPKGAVDENGNIKKDSIFYKNDNYKGLQNLEVKFFARPRTADEFRAVIENDKDNYGTYTSTGAGEGTINHKGTDVVIDKQGIDRYDHYNLIGGFKLNLDDTRYYDQGFFDDNDEDTSKHTSSPVKPGEDFNVDLYVPEDKSNKDLFPNQKTPEEMQTAKDNNQATASVDRSFLNKVNEDKKPEDQWQLEFDEKKPTSLKIIPPKSAKAGEFVAVPLTYTYTNGSTDTHWFHFVVQESTNNKPEYSVKVDYPSEGQNSQPELPEDPDNKKLPPKSYSIPEGTEFKDDKGNEWTVSIDEKTGVVNAKPLDPSKFDGGETLTVPVIAHYEDPNEPEKNITEKTKAEFVIKERANMTPRYNAKAGKAGDELASDVILNTEDRYNRRPGKYTLESNTYKDDKGNTWNVSIDEETGVVTATVPNAEEGKLIDGALLNVPVTAHYYEADSDTELATKEVEVQFVSYGTNGKVEKTVEVPFETKVVKDPKLKKGEIKVITEGKKGSKKVTYTIEDSKIVKEEEQELEAPEVREIHVGEGVNDGTHTIEEKVEVPFETEIQFDDSLAPGEKKVTQEGEAGEKKRGVTLTIEDGNVTKTETGEFTETKAPKKRIIKVGRNTEGKVEHKEELPFKYEVEYVDDLKKGEYRIAKPGKVGTKTTTWTIENSKVVGKPTEEIVPAEDALIQVGKGTNDGTHEVTEKKSIDYKTIIEYDENLDAGQQEVVKEGNPGKQERTNTLVIKDGQVTETKEGEFKTTKEATDRVVKIGTKPVTKTVEKPFNTEYVYDENLEAGETEEVTPGKNGKVTITTTYDKDQKKVVTSETEEAGQNRVVKIGGKTNGTEKVKEEIPFEVEVRKDPSLKKGEWKYAKDDAGNELKGEKGEQEKTLTIVNSKVTETSEPTVTKEAKNAVILVGEGTNDGTHEIVEKKELPFETRYEYDDSLEPGEEKIVTPGSPGEEERTNTIVIKDGKVVEVKEGEFKTTKEPQERLIKIGRKPTEGETTKTIEREIPYETKVIYDENLEAGFQRIEKEGKPGKEEVTITQKIKDSKPVGDPTETTKTITEKEYRVVRVGVKPVEKIVELGNNTEYRHNPELKAGEEKVIEEGSKGSVKYTTTFNKETGKLEVTEERVEPKNKVVEYGSKTEGKVVVNSDIPFEVEIIEDPELEAGKTEVVQEGKLGEKETTITIENSKEVSREDKTITEPTKKIIKVGTKNVCEIPPEKPEEPETPEDPDKEEPINPGTPDEEDPVDPEVPGEDKPETPEDPDKEEPIIPGTPDKDKPELPTIPETPDEDTPDLPSEEEPDRPDYKDEDEVDVDPDPDKETPEEEITPGDDTDTPDDSKESDDKDKGQKPESSDKPGTPDKSEDSKEETPDKKDEDDKVVVPSPEKEKVSKGKEDDDKDAGSLFFPTPQSSKSTSERVSGGTSGQSNVARSPRSGHTNVETGVSGAISVASILAAASIGLAASKKKEDNEDEE